MQITLDELTACIKALKSGKICGLDGIYNEHIVKGSMALRVSIVALFNKMLAQSYVPATLKQGCIITLFKGGNKRRDDPSSYRAITLSSCLLKLYERILLGQIKDQLTIPIHPLQGGFQSGMGCVMTSFLVRECVSFCKENKSKLFACFLDARQAFDRVWHNGLFFKLRQMGITGQLWQFVVNMHSDMFSCVLYKGRRSDWFPILQSTRQGGHGHLFSIYAS